MVKVLGLDVPKCHGRRQKSSSRKESNVVVVGGQDHSDSESESNSRSASETDNESESESTSTSSPSLWQISSASESDTESVLESTSSSLSPSPSSTSISSTISITSSLSSAAISSSESETENAERFPGGGIRRRRYRPNERRINQQRDNNPNYQPLVIRRRGQELLEHVVRERIEFFMYFLDEFDTNIRPMFPRAQLVGGRSIAQNYRGRGTNPIIDGQRTEQAHSVQVSCK